MILTKAIINKLSKNPIYVHDGKPPEQVPVILKIFNPYGPGTWYITEAELQNDTWISFGYACLAPGCGELGYIPLSELLALQPIPGLNLERDRHLKDGYTLADAMSDN